MACKLIGDESERQCDDNRLQGDAPSPKARQIGPVPDGFSIRK